MKPAVLQRMISEAEARLNQINCEIAKLADERNSCRMRSNQFRQLLAAKNAIHASYHR